MKYVPKFLLLLLIAVCFIFASKPERQNRVPSGYSDVQTSLQTNYYGLVHLALAAAAYIDGGDTSKMALDFKNDIGSLAVLPNPQSGATLDSASWHLEWGPAFSSDNANLVYVATCGPISNPYLRVVGLRGTDMSSSHLGILKQLEEDFRAFGQKDWFKYLNSLAKGQNPYKQKVAPKQTALVANGTLEALTKVLSLVPKSNAASPGTTLIQHLYKVQPQLTVPLVVTGHSLGAALTQAVSSYLAWQMAGAFTSANQTACGMIFPNAFAPPTIGDTTFVRLYDTIFPYNFFWFNQSDVVPYGFVNVTGVASLWGTYPDSYSKTGQGVPCPGDLVNFINKIAPHVPNYARPNNNIYNFTASYLGNTDTMSAFLSKVFPNKKKPFNPESWLAQLIWQHFPPCYYNNIKIISGVKSYPAFVQ
jgi:hypothetical protein